MQLSGDLNFSLTLGGQHYMQDTNCVCVLVEARYGLYMYDATP